MTALALGVVALVLVGLVAFVIAARWATRGTTVMNWRR